MSAPYAITADERERLILEHMPKVRWIAANIHERFPSGVVDQDDLISSGMVGLIRAIDNFDPTRNVSLWTYAEHRIRGAILDSIRGMDGIADHQRKRARQVQEAIAAAEQRLGRSPSEDEIACALGISLTDYQDMLLDLQGVMLGSLDACGPDDENSAMVRYIADPQAPDPAQLFERAELTNLLATGIEKLSESERIVLHLYFEEKLTLREIGTVMTLHFSRVSQLKSQALLRLRAFMEYHTTTRSRRSR